MRKADKRRGPRRPTVDFSTTSITAKQEREKLWLEYKQQVIDAIDDFSYIYGDLEKQRSSAEGWVYALCPFHHDRKSSFSYNIESGWWECHKGCGRGSVFDYLMKKKDATFKAVLVELGDQLGIPRPSSKRGMIVGQVYEYQDETGTVLFEVVRGHDKTFTQRRPDGKGGHIRNLKGVRRVLYNLPELVNHRKGKVFIVEGEKDADRLDEEGLLATTNPGGAGKWKPEYNDILRDRNVVIIPDNDAPGRSHGLQVAKQLHGVAKSIKVVELLGLPEKGDVSDWLDEGHTIIELRQLVRRAEKWSPALDHTAVYERPLIHVNDRQLFAVIEDAWKGILDANDPPKVFVTSGSLARIREVDGNPEIVLMNEAATYGLLLRVANWARGKDGESRDAKPPREVAQDIMVNPHPDLPPLDSVISTPVFDRNGRVTTGVGYYREERLWYYKPKGFRLKRIPTHPTEAQIAGAKRLLFEELLVDFPFTADSDRAHAVAGLILPFVRRMICGCTPIHLLESPTPSSGKGLLANLISIVALGRKCAPTTVTWNAEETRKKITAVLIRGNPIVLIDNVRGKLESSELASTLTAETWSDRILGRSQMVAIPNRATWLVTANNPKLSMEIVRRCVRIRLDPDKDRPWLRTGFKHDPIADWAIEKRAELVRAVLTLIQSWITAGSVPGDKTLGSFESWSATIGGILEHNGIAGFLEDADRFYEDADVESREWRAFVECWWKQHSDRWVTARDLYKLAKARDLIGFALEGNSDSSRKVRFGRSLATIRDRCFGNKKVTSKPDKHRKVARYRLVQVG